MAICINGDDLLVFELVERFGFVTASQIEDYTGITPLPSRLSKLVKEDYLSCHKIFHQKPAVYSVTNKSNLLDLPLVKKIDVSDYTHDLLVIDVFLKIRHKFSSYVTEKELRMQRGIGYKGRIPDLIGCNSDGKIISVEVDRTPKSLKRLKEIVATYNNDKSYDEVWFICGGKFIYNNLDKVSYGDKIKLFNLSDVLAGNELVYLNQKKHPLLTGELKRILGKFFE
jgi:hypothetical protein